MAHGSLPVGLAVTTDRDLDRLAEGVVFDGHPNLTCVAEIDR